MASLEIKKLNVRNRLRMIKAMILNKPIVIDNIDLLGAIKDALDKNRNKVINYDFTDEGSYEEVT